MVQQISKNSYLFTLKYKSNQRTKFMAQIPFQVLNMSLNNLAQLENLYIALYLILQQLNNMDENMVQMDIFRSKIHPEDIASLVFPALSTKFQIKWMKTNFLNQVVIFFSGSCKGMLRAPTKGHLLYADYRGNQNNPLIIIGIKKYKKGTVHGNLDLLEPNHQWNTNFDQILRSNLIIQEVPLSWSIIQRDQSNRNVKKNSDLFIKILQHGNSSSQSSNNDQKLFLKCEDYSHYANIKDKISKLEYQIPKVNLIEKSKKIHKRQHVPIQLPIFKSCVMKAPFKYNDQGAAVYPAKQTQIQVSWAKQGLIKQGTILINKNLQLSKPIQGSFLYIIYYGLEKWPYVAVGFKTYRKGEICKIHRRIPSNWSKELKQQLIKNLNIEEIPANWLSGKKVQNDHT